LFHFKDLFDCQKISWSLVLCFGSLPINYA